MSKSLCLNMLRARTFYKEAFFQGGQRPFDQKANWREMNYPHRKGGIFQLKNSWRVWVEVIHKRRRKAEMPESEKDCSLKRIMLPKMSWDLQQNHGEKKM